MPVDNFGFTFKHCEGFTLCGGQRDPYAVITHPNSGNRSQSQFIYPFEGTATLVADGIPSMQMVTGLLNDMSHFGGHNTVVHFGPAGGRWIAINPSPETKLYDAILLKDGQSTTVTGTQKECVALTLQGSSVCNTTEIPEMQFASITEGKQVTVTAQAGSVVVILTER